MSYISEAKRQQILQRAKECCEYCQTQQKVIIKLEIDHIVPESRGGSDELDNLCAACRQCNGYKQHYETGIDPETEQKHPLFNPRKQQWQEHFVWKEDKTILIGLTPIGRATIARLQINAQENVDARITWTAVGLHPPHFD